MNEGKIMNKFGAVGMSGDAGGGWSSTKGMVSVIWTKQPRRSNGGTIDVVRSGPGLKI